MVAEAQKIGDRSKKPEVVSHLFSRGGLMPQGLKRRHNTWQRVEENNENYRRVEPVA